VVDGVEGQLEPVRNPDLVENVMEVVLDGLFADEEFPPSLCRRKKPMAGRICAYC